VATNSLWRFLRGTAEASTPADAWRQAGFDDSTWEEAPAVFYFGETWAVGTLIPDMLNRYSSIFLRRKFTVNNPAFVSDLRLRAQCDDGFIVWINGVEARRYNMPAGNIPFNGFASSAVTETNRPPTVPFITYPLTNAAASLVAGENIVAVQVFNAALNSSDLVFDMELSSLVSDPAELPPVIVGRSPVPINVFNLTQFAVAFSEPVSGVDASDLLVNGAAAIDVSGSNDFYTFSFPQPPYGPVLISWVGLNGIQDLDTPPKAFDGLSAGAMFQYTLINPNTPTIVSQSPPAGATVSNLAQIVVNFSKPVTEVDAGDLLINGVPATSLTGAGASRTFTFPQPPFGPVSIQWAAAHGIKDLEVPPNDFDPARPGGLWTYTLVDRTAPGIVSQVPSAGAQVTNLTQINVTFGEPVIGVNASDLLINGVPAASLAGSGANYIFAFPQPNATIVRITWAPNHGIRDLAAAPNLFEASAPDSTWSYTTPDTVAPGLANLDPPAFVTLRSLTQLRVTFTEAVSGVDTNDLVINGRPARSVSGFGAGPYTFNFLAPSNGPVQVRWAAAHGIGDLAVPPNPFAGGEWSYTLDPNASFAGKVLINEIMFNPLGGRTADEWIELRNLTTNTVNVTAWRFTKGVAFTFPNVAIPGEGYLVVAADLAAFQTKYPTVTNVVGGWSGQLANSDETIELTTALGETVNSVHYASEGDWAQRERGRGASVVSGITRNGNTATVSIFGHGYANNDQVVISGATPPEYNGRFVVTGVTPGTFNIAVSGSPATPATGSILSRQVLMLGSSGWSWFCAADGFGSSLELINPSLPSDSGQNWLVSSSQHGTPGRANSVLNTNVAPFILDVTHVPAVPRSTDPVAVAARVRDELTNGVQNVTLFYRDHSSRTPASFLSVNMSDDGLHSDGVAQDGLYAAILPPAANGTVIEFYVQATDRTGFTRTWPAPARDTNSVFGQLANALYQVDNEAIAGVMPSVRIIMTETERSSFPPANRNSDAEMNATFITLDGDGTKVRYNSGVRLRGAGTRSRNPPNNRVNLPNDNRWNGLKAVNLNSQFVHAQLVGNVLARKSGIAATDAHVIQYRINGANPAPLNAPSGGNGAGYGTFLMLLPVNGDLAESLYPQDADGNFYRASTGNHNADLSYQGTNPANYLSRGYYKTSNQTENDWTDFINLTSAFSQIGPDADYVNAISTNLNVAEWMRYFAVGTLMNFGETALFNGIGDDHALYRGTTDRRFVIIGHDFDTIFGQGDTGANYYPINTNSSIFIMMNPPNSNANVPVLRRFMTNAAFAPIFYAELKQLCDTTFHPSQLDPLMDQLLNGWGSGPSAATIASMKSYAANRRAVALSQIPLALTVSNLPAVQNGYPSTLTSTVTLSGTAHAIDTRKVLVNGSAAIWSAWEARWTNTVTLQPGLNRVLVQSLNSSDAEFARAFADIWYDDGSVQNAGGAITSDTVWSAGNGPYQITANLTINSGATLTIQPGTTVYLNSGVNVTVANGGRLLAEGTETAPIRFTRAPGTTAPWGGITINGGAGSPETRLTYAHLEFNGAAAIHTAAGTVFLDHLTFGSTDRQYLSLDGSSFVVSHCVFPTPTGAFEPVHGAQGIKSGGRGLFLRNFFGKTSGYNDTVDFTGGNRPGPVVQFINNVFIGSDDDILDLDSTDAWVEGNIFLHTHKNGSPDSSSAVSGGADNADTSQVTIIGNLFYDCDQAAMAKQGDFFTLINNTIVRQTIQGGLDTEGGVICVADNNAAEGAGMYLEGNIIYDAEQLVRNRTAAVVTFTNNVMKLSWSGPGGGNSAADPALKHIPQLAETAFTTWEQAQVMWDWFSLLPGSPALGTGPNGRDQGGVIPLGASISGEPVGTTRQTTATLTVGVNRTGSAIPTSGFPNGSGFTHYKWRLDSGLWSVETPITAPITLSGLADGPHYVEVAGKLDSAFYQDDAAYGLDAVVTLSRTWIVSPGASDLRLNEVLASNAGALNHNATTPDAIELYNAGPTPLDLSGVRLTDDPQNPDKFIFPPNTILAAGSYLVVYANNPDGTPGFHLGFNLAQQGETIYLLDSAVKGGALLDSVSFGLQLTDYSIGRLADGAWALTTPSFGGANAAARIGDPRALAINEWLAIGQSLFANDFVELYNPQPWPVALGGLYISDNPLSWPNRHPISGQSYLPAFGFQRFFADGNAAQGADHLNFQLESQQGFIGLFQADLTPIDVVAYGSQRPDISQGRSPNGSATIVFFDQPTPGAPNPLAVTTPTGGALVINEVLASNASLAELDGRVPDWIELYNGTSETVNLGDLSLTDDTQQPRRFVFPAGVQLASGGYLRVLCDDGLPASTNNTGFGLKSTGAAVYLFESPARGGSLLNSVAYGLQTPDFSIGRVPSGSTNWTLTLPSPNGANAAVPTLGNPSNLRVNEWMADPASGDDWFEIYNPDPQPVALGGLYLTDDLNSRDKHKLPALSFLGVGVNAWHQFIADGNTGAGADHAGFSFKASGEAIGIFTPTGATIDAVTFGAQQTGVSEGRFPDGSANVIIFPGTASPGAANFRRLAEVAINEVLTHTDPPLEDAIELFNLTAQPIDISGWWLSDDRGAVQKYQIPSPTLLPARGFAVIYENQLTNRTLAAVPFSISSKGDEVILSAAANNRLTGFRANVEFGAAENGVSFGRYFNSVGAEQFVALGARTFGVDNPGTVEQFRLGKGASNAAPRVGPIVISEIMYHPPDTGGLDNTRDEFIELQNITTGPVPLSDPLHPTNTWRLRGVVDYDFPANVVLPANGTLLVVGFDPVGNAAALAAFRAQYGLSPSVPIYGPFQGKLANDAGSVELFKPDPPQLPPAPDVGFVPYVLVERVRYTDRAPWPTAADGGSASLQRLRATQFGDDPVNWMASAPTPGLTDSPNPDSDGDGIPDAWETRYGLNPSNPADASLDADRDGLTNLQEFVAGTDPNSAQSALRLEAALSVAGGKSVVTLHFNAIADKTYTVQYRTEVSGGAWTSLSNVPSQPANRTIEIVEALSSGAARRFYRLITPAVP
jgi:hypothetical protein